MAGRQGPFGWTTQPKRSATPPGVFLAVPSPLRCGFRRRSLRRPFRNFVLGKSLCKKSWSPTLIRRSKQEVSCVKPKTAVFPPCCPRYWSRRTTTPVSDGSRRWRNPRAAGICCSAGRPQRIWKKQSAACCRRVRGLSSWSGTHKARSAWPSSAHRPPPTLTRWTAGRCAVSCFCTCWPSAPARKHPQTQSSGTACTMKTGFCATASQAR